MENLFEMGIDSGMEAFAPKTASKADGIYRVDPKKAIDKKRGYRSVVRFLPNFTKEMTLGPNAIEKYVHYVNIKTAPELNGYYDSMKNFTNEKCALTDTFWELKNSTSVVEQEKAKLISRTQKFYSYVLVMEDEQQPENVGKIMIFPFGSKIKNKINEERTGELTGTPCNVYDLSNGKDFILLVKEVAGFPNYDSSQFKQNTSAISISRDGIFKEVPTTESNGKRTIDSKYQEKIKDFLLSRENDLNEYAPKKWDEETRNKVYKICALLKGANPIVEANKIVSSVSKNDDTFFETASSSAKDDDDFFSL